MLSHRAKRWFSDYDAIRRIHLPEVVYRPWLGPLKWTSFAGRWKVSNETSDELGKVEAARFSLQVKPWVFDLANSIWLLDQRVQVCCC